MTGENLTQLWKWLSLACFAYVVGSVISIQGGVDVFGAKLFADIKKDGREVVAYYAVIVGGVLLSVALAVAILFAKRHGSSWHSRIPVVFFDRLYTQATESKLFQLTVATIFVIVPLTGIVISMRVANEGIVCEQMPQGKPPIHHESGRWRLLRLPAADNQLRLMTHDTNKETCGGSGVEVGWWTPILFGLGPFLALLLTVGWLGLLIRPAP